MTGLFAGSEWRNLRMTELEGDEIGMTGFYIFTSYKKQKLLDSRLSGNDGLGDTARELKLHFLPARVCPINHCFKFRVWFVIVILQQTPAAPFWPGAYAVIMAE